MAEVHVTKVEKQSLRGPRKIWLLTPKNVLGRCSVRTLVKSATAGIKENAAIVVDLTGVSSIVGDDDVLAALVNLDQACIDAGVASNLKIAAAPRMERHLRDRTDGRHFLFYRNRDHAVENCA